MNHILTQTNDPKLTRRAFLKLAGVSAAALCAGYGAGRLSLPSGSQWHVLQAFLPEDETLAASLVAAFVSLTGATANIFTSGDERYADVLRRAAHAAGISAGGGMLTFHLGRLQKPVPADLLLGDSQEAVYDPGRHFNRRFAALRQQMHGQWGNLVLRAAHQSRTRPDTGKLFAVIHGSQGVLDRIPLSSNYHNISVPGPLGQSSLGMSDGRLWVQKPSCRHHLCQLAGPIANPGDRVVCAPNRLLVEIELV